MDGVWVWPLSPSREAWGVLGVLQSDSLSQSIRVIRDLIPEEALPGGHWLRALQGLQARLRPLERSQRDPP